MSDIGIVGPEHSTGLSKTQPSRIPLPGASEETADGPAVPAPRVDDEGFEPTIIRGRE